MKIFTYKKDNKVAVILGFNKGHACKMLAKELEKEGKSLEKTDTVSEIDLKEETKGKVIFL